MRKIVLFISVIFFISCSNQQSNEEDVPSFETEIKDLREINNELINTSPKEIKTVFKLGVKIKNIALNLYVRNHKSYSDEENEFLLQCAATGSEAAQKYKDATDYFLKAQRKFPNSKNAPIYLHNRARILDNILEDKNNARLAFEELIELYPQHQLSINAQLYLDNAFGKSDQELLDLIN